MHWATPFNEAKPIVCSIADTNYVEQTTVDPEEEKVCIN